MRRKRGSSMLLSAVKQVSTKDCWLVSPTTYIDVLSYPKMERVPWIFLGKMVSLEDHQTSLKPLFGCLQIGSLLPE